VRPKEDIEGPYSNVATEPGRHLVR
jgi:hypothetical protein